MGLHPPMVARLLWALCLPLASGPLCLHRLAVATVPPIHPEASLGLTRKSFTEAAPRSLTTPTQVRANRRISTGVSGHLGEGEWGQTQARRR